MTPLQKAIAQARALKTLPEQKKLFKQLADETMKLAKQQERLRHDVAELMRQCEDWRAERVKQVQVSVPGVIGMIQRMVCKEMNVSIADLLSQRRHHAIVRPRQIAMWLARQCSMRSLPEIGRLSGERDHTTVLHAVRRIEEARTREPELDRLLARLKEQVEERIAAKRQEMLAASGGDQPCHPPEATNGPKQLPCD
jgi:hypothetical protein